jgi:hypothetical protein
MNALQCGRNLAKPDLISGGQYNVMAVCGQQLHEGAPDSAGGACDYG